MIEVLEAKKTTKILRDIQRRRLVFFFFFFRRRFFCCEFAGDFGGAESSRFPITWIAEIDFLAVDLEFCSK